MTYWCRGTLSYGHPAPGTHDLHAANGTAVTFLRPLDGSTNLLLFTAIPNGGNLHGTVEAAN